MREKGQAVIILLLIMLVALTIGLAITQRSLTSISISNKGEESSRAFSAAEAGVEEALQTGTPPPISNLGNSSTAVVNISNTLPPSSQPGVALELPPISRNTTAQFWLASGFNTPGNGSIVPYYQTNSFSIYFGDPAISPSDKPAIEVDVLTFAGGGYATSKFYFDSDTTRSGNNLNGFTPLASCGTYTIQTVGASSVNSPSNSNFYCFASVSFSGTPVLARVRMFYSNSNQKVALQPSGVNSLPPQAQVFTSVGTSGQTQRTVQVVRLPKVIPQLFDFALFSVGPVQKCDGC